MNNRIKLGRKYRLSFMSGLFLSAFFLLCWFAPDNARAQNLDNLIDYSIVPKYIEIDGEQVKTDNQILYAEKTNLITDKEIISSNKFKKNNTYTIFPIAKFYLEKGQWFQIDYKYSDIENIDNFENNDVKELGFIKAVLADTIYASSSCSNLNTHQSQGLTTCQAAIDTANALSACTSSALNTQVYRYSDWRIYRASLVFDTLELSGQINNASLFTTVKTASGDNRKYCLAYHEREDPNTLTISEYNKTLFSDIITATCTPAVIEQTDENILINFDGINLGGYSYFGFRHWEDYTGVCSDAISYVYLYDALSEYPPYLEITLSEPEATSTPTVYNYSCEPDDPDDITMITSCTFASSTGIIYTNYRARFLIVLVLYAIIIFIAIYLLEIYSYKIDKWTSN